MTGFTFDIPYIYKVSGVPKRGSRQRTELAYEKIQATVPIVTSDDAPVAAVFPEQLGSPAYLSERGHVTLRSFGDRLYAKALMPDIRNPLDATPEMLSAFLAGGIYSIASASRLSPVLPDAPETVDRALFPKDDDGGNPIRLFDADRWLSWSSENQAEARAKANRLFNDLVVIDGLFWRATHEPVYVLSRTHEGPHDFVSTTITPITDAAKKDRESVFSLNSWEYLISCSMERWGMVPDERERATVFSESAFTYDTTMWQFIDSITMATEHDGDRLKSFDVESMILWAEMRNALALAKATDYAHPTLDALAAAAERYASGPTKSQRALSLIAKALETLDDRSVNIPLAQPPRP
jgi:hypothetical protein